MMPVRVYHLDTGGCGACAAELWATVEGAAVFVWATGPAQADVVALTGSLTAPTQAAAEALYREFWEGRVPLVAVGRCAIDGYPYGKGGLAALPGVVVHAKVEGCAPVPAVIELALLQSVGRERAWNRR